MPGSPARSPAAMASWVSDDEPALRPSRGRIGAATKPRRPPTVLPSPATSSPGSPLLPGVSLLPGDLRGELPMAATQPPPLGSIVHSTAEMGPDNKPRKICTYCGTKSTPLWRSGPKEFKLLCNSCGVKWKRGKILGGPKPKPVSAIGLGGSSPSAPAAAARSTSLPANHSFLSGQKNSAACSDATFSPSRARSPGKRSRSASPGPFVSSNAAHRHNPLNYMRPTSPQNSSSPRHSSRLRSVTPSDFSGYDNGSYSPHGHLSYDGSNNGTRSLSNLHNSYTQDEINEDGEDHGAYRPRPSSSRTSSSSSRSSSPAPMFFHQSPFKNAFKEPFHFMTEATLAATAVSLSDTQLSSLSTLISSPSLPVSTLLKVIPVLRTDPAWFRLGLEDALREGRDVEIRIEEIGIPTWTRVWALIV